MFVYAVNRDGTVETVKASPAVLYARVMSGEMSYDEAVNMLSGRDQKRFFELWAGVMREDSTALYPFRDK